MIDANRPSSKNLRSLTFALGFLRPYGGTIFLASLALLFTSGITLSLGQGLRFLVDEGFGEGSQELLDRAVLMFIGIAFLLSVGTYVRHYLVSWIGERATADIRKAVFDRVISLHPGFFEMNSSGEIQSRITTDTTLIQSVIGSSVSIALRNAIVFLGGLVLMFLTDLKLTLIVLLGVPLVVAPILIFGRRVRKLSRSAQDRMADVGSYVGEALQNIKTVQAYNHQEHDRTRFSERVEAAFDTARRRIRQRSFLIAVVILFVVGSLCAMIWIGGQDVIDGHKTGGQLLAFGFYAFMVGASVGAVSEVIGELQRAAGATERLAELYEAENLITVPETPARLPVVVRGRLVARNLKFFYDSRPEAAAIDDLDLDAEPGETLALVGPSGAGKSTLFDLLLRFYDPAGGHILLDDVDIRSLDPHELRKHIGIVPQQPALFTGTVADNIRYGRPDASDAEVRDAATAAYAAEFIDRLPEGYATFVGERGVRLSGGQRQRIAVARAILKDPRVLLLDEATSALDAESEFMVQQALTELMQNRTTLVIAHRLATVRDAHRIAVLDHGRIVALGSHEELLTMSPLYARLAELQFRTSLAPGG